MQGVFAIVNFAAFLVSEKFKHDISQPEAAERIRYETSAAFEVDESQRPPDTPGTQVPALFEPVC